MIENPEKIKLSIVIPAYNEAIGITATLESVEKYLMTQSFHYEILVVANNCSDNTAQVISEYQKKSNNVKLLDVKIAEPGGAKGHAVKIGMLEVRGDYRLFMDADSATRIEEVEKFWPYFERGFEVAIASRYIQGSKIIIKQPWHRILLGRAGNFLIRSLLLPKIRDTQCGFKAFTKNASEIIFAKITIGGWGFDMEVLALAKKFGFLVAEVPVDWYDAKRSRLDVRSAGPKVFRELLQIRRNIKKGYYDQE